MRWARQLLQHLFRQLTALASCAPTGDQHVPVDAAMAELDAYLPLAGQTSTVTANAGKRSGDTVGKSSGMRGVRRLYATSACR